MDICFAVGRSHEADSLVFDNAPIGSCAQCDDIAAANSRTVIFLTDCRNPPLIGVWLEIVINKDTVTVLPCLSLKREGYEIAKSAIGQRVLIREETVVRLERHSFLSLHRLCEYDIAKPPGITSCDFLLEENPDMCAVAGTRNFYVCRDFPVATYRKIRFYIVMIAVFATLVIEISAKEEATV